MSRRWSRQRSRAAAQDDNVPALWSLQPSPSRAAWMTLAESITDLPTIPTFISRSNVSSADQQGGYRRPLSPGSDAEAQIAVDYLADDDDLRQRFARERGSSPASAARTS